MASPEIDQSKTLRQIQIDAESGNGYLLERALIQNPGILPPAKQLELLILAHSTTVDRTQTITQSSASADALSRYRKGLDELKSLETEGQPIPEDFMTNLLTPPHPGNPLFNYLEQANIRNWVNRPKPRDRSK